MTQLVSGSMFADALITTLIAQSASVFSSASLTGNLTKNDFGLLDTTTSACVFVVLPGPNTFKPTSYGDPNAGEFTTELKIRSFVRDVGNSACTLGMVWQAERDVRNALQADTSLGGSAMLAYLKHSSGWDGLSTVNAGGQDWIPQDFTVEVFQAT